MINTDKITSLFKGRAFFIIGLFLMTSLGFSGQEINSNATDDDGDCNIDCDDLSFAVRSLAISNYMQASFVVGQDDFTTNPSGCDEYSFNLPYDVAIDPATEKVFVSDVNNHRILRYASVNDFIFANQPEIVIGQTNFTNNSTGVSSTQLNQPTGVFVDHDGILWVTDWGNNRVLRYDNASSISTGVAADGVLGQSTFFTNSYSTSATGMYIPVDVVVSTSGTLWVADQSNGRALRFDNAKLKSNGASADGVLGAPNFTTYSTRTNNVNLYSANGLALICGSLFVSDGMNNRVLRWDNAASLANGATADAVLGQPNFTSYTPATSASGMSKPRMLGTDKFNNLYLSESGNHRVIVFNEANSKLTGASADKVLGQPNFTSFGAALGDRNFNTPRGVICLETGNRSYLVVADATNQRYMVFGHEYLSTNENSVISSTLPGEDAAGVGGLTYAVTVQPEFGTVTVTNSSTGAYTYTPQGLCPNDADYEVTFTYSITNSIGCLATGEIIIRVTDVGPCVEDCSNGIDDDLDCNIDCEDSDCGVRTFELTDGMDASFVVGQPDYTSNASGVDQDSFDGMYDVAVDPISKKVFVADDANNRVLRYSSYDDFINGVSPEVVIGQTNFTSKITGLSAVGLHGPTGITVDDSGILWVADWRNNRVLRFDNAANISSGSSADGVLGQPNFTTNSSSRTASKMDAPVDIVVDAFGNLFVAEQDNGRVIRFDNAAAKSNGSAADGVLGENSFTSNNTATNSSNLEYPCGIAMVCNSLFVADFNKNRILRWDNPASLANGASAHSVLGQSDFNTSLSGLSPATLYQPRMLNSDSKNNLYVSDAGNHRVLVFNESTGLNIGANADHVIGQPNFYSNSTGLDQNSFDEPRGLAVIENGLRSYLAVADRANNRILLFGTDNFTTDEVTSITSVLPGHDPSGSGIVAFSILTDPIYGSFVINNAQSGSFTYTPILNCSVNNDVYDHVTYSVINGNGCTEYGQLMILVTDVGPCAEICDNGLDDDLNGFIDDEDPACDRDGDFIMNKNDIDNDNDGITDAIESNVLSSACPYTVSRDLYFDDFGSGTRTSSTKSTMCYENNSNVTCSPDYNVSTYTSSLDKGEYAVVATTDEANQGQYGWASLGDQSGLSGGRMAVFNPSFNGQVLYETVVDGVVPNVNVRLRIGVLNLWQSGSGETIPNLRINVMDNNHVVIHTTTLNITEDENWSVPSLNYNYGNYNSLIFQFVNNQSTVSGNDFALDYIRISQDLKDCDDDGIANMFDLDSDNDGLTDLAEQNGVDADFDGVTDNVNGLGLLTNDLNSNGADDAYEGKTLLDSDSDLVIDIHDLDSDNDGIFDVIESGGVDSNYDGKIGSSFVDANANGLNDLVDPTESGTGLAIKDTDSNGIIDSKDSDSDGDGCKDVVEAGFIDGDSNGFLGTGSFGSGLIVNNKGVVIP